VQQKGTRGGGYRRQKEGKGEELSVSVEKQ
jgi:hypothetical protein